MDATFKLIDFLEETYGNPIFFFFCRREEKIAANQVYFAKLPIEQSEIWEVRDFNQTQGASELKSTEESKLGSTTENEPALSRQTDPKKGVP